MINFIAEGYTVKSVKFHTHSEGWYFEGNLYKGSVKIASFEEEGRGGPMNIWTENEDLYQDFVSYCKTTEDSDYSEIDAIVIENMAHSFRHRKEVMSARKKKVLFWTKDGENAPVQEWAIAEPYNEKLVKYIVDKYGETLLCIGNEEFDIYPDGVSRVYREV